MDEIDKEFIAFYKKVAGTLGLDDLTATLFAKLYIEPKEVTMEFLSKETGYSLASISNKIRFLEKLGLLEKRTLPGSKKYYFFMKKNFYDIFKKTIEMRQENVLKPAKEIIPKIIEQNKGADKEKLNILKRYDEQIRKLDNLFTEMLQKFAELG